MAITGLVPFPTVGGSNQQNTGITSVQIQPARVNVIPARTTAPAPESNELSAAELSTMKTYLTAAINRNRLQKVRDVKYNKETGEVESIPHLQFNVTTRKFTLKRNDKRISTLNSLGSGTNNTRKKRGSKSKKSVDNDN